MGCKHGGWCIAGNAGEYRLSEERQAVIEVLRNAGSPLGPRDVAEALDKPSGAIRELLSQMVASSDVRKLGYGKYNAISPDTQGITDGGSVSGVSGFDAPDDYNRLVEERQAEFGVALEDGWRSPTRLVASATSVCTDQVGAA